MKEIEKQQSEKDDRYENDDLFEERKSDELPYAEL